MGMFDSSSDRPADSSRRQFCGLGLAGFTFGFKDKAKSKRSHFQDTKLYHGPLMISQDVIDVAYRSPRAVRTTARKNAVKVYHDDIAYVFRVLGGQCYLGEIVQTQQGKIRVHVWGLIEGPVKTVQQILDYRLHGIDTPQIEETVVEKVVTDRDDLTEEYLR